MGRGTTRRTVLSSAAAACFAPPARAASAASYHWTNVKVGGGGFVPGIVFSRAEQGLAYLRSDMGGLYRWDNWGNSPVRTMYSKGMMVFRATGGDPQIDQNWILQQLRGI